MRFKRVFFIEIDAGGSWRPRSLHYGTVLRRWVVGPVSFGWQWGNFNDFVSVFKQMAEDQP